jgi:hypothetical protein
MDYIGMYGFGEHGSETSRYIKGGKFDHLSDYQLLNNDSTSGSYLMLNGIYHVSWVDFKPIIPPIP